MSKLQLQSQEGGEPIREENAKCDGPTFLNSVADPRVRGNKVIHCLADLQVKGMKAPNSCESYGCLTVDRK